MVELQKGHYLSETNRIYPADDVLVGLTTYQKVLGTSTLHSHRNPHLSFVLKGTMQVRRKTLFSDRTAPEQISFMHGQEVHQVTPLSQFCKNINLELEASFFRRYDLNEQIIAENIRKNGPANGLLMVRLYKELIHLDDSFNESVQMLLLAAASGWLKTESTLPGWLFQVRELLHDRWQETISLTEIAHIARVHPVTMSRYFLRYFGTSLGEYRRRVKIERAIGLLTTTNRPLAEIAYRCGFSDQSHFIRAFKEQTGLLPKGIRS
ncbi:helix-turn-helix transcriptional regulator [Spirosoma linguale]|uniref:Transcriptional regulator, AraC family n=1 Tax=Spirosoma linguale (strain ATCC 33905 / DSM 74 / LMG 10896 / Claus 1) TaxID=504472 RepID=D2QEG9_SPILD|nr:transcriptional regulator, AraC family [Spirosoma linguale DSM 74]